MGIFDEVGSLRPWRDERRERHDGQEGAPVSRSPEASTWMRPRRGWRTGC
jgi:hypothetical protein